MSARPAAPGRQAGAWKVTAFRAGVAAARWTPESLADLICRAAGRLGYRLATRARGNVLANLRHALPDVGGSERRRVAGRVFYHVARNYYDLLRARWLTDADLARRFTFEGRERLDAALAVGAGVVIVTAHQGNFSVAPLYAAVVGVPSTVAMEELQPPALYDLIAGLRTGSGVRVAPAGPGGLRAMLATLRRGEPLVLVGDRDITGTGVAVPFFGRPARLPSGPAFLALRTGATLLPMYTVRVARDRSVLRVLAPVEVVRTGDRDADVTATTTRLAAALEAAIRAAPEQWVVLQALWGGDEDGRQAFPPPPSPPSDDADDPY
jgi:KDO2-lipid IV(A) lauroyltransferase